MFNFLITLLHDNKRYTVLTESKQSFYSVKNPLIINLKGKLQNLFYLFLGCQRRSISLLTCWLKYHVVLSCRGIGQFNCDNRSQQHVEAIHGSFDFIGPTPTS